jgi:hypothetical protein
MITRALFTLSISLAATSVFGQSLEKILDKDVPVIWVGLDFSNAKLIGDREKYGSLSDIQYLIKAWNDLIETEKERYNVARFTRKKTAEYHAEIARKRNDELDVSVLLSNVKEDNAHLKQDDIETIVHSYDFEALTGLGLMFNVESLSELHHQAAIWTTFIDLSSKEIIATERFITGPSGNGMRNYWGRSFLEAMEKLERQIELWRKKNIQK